MNPMLRMWLGLVLTGVTSVASAQPMPIVTTIGCVDGDERTGFMLTRATEPTALEERTPDEPPADAPLGAATLRLVGTLDEFGVAGHTGHKVWAKGLLNPGDPHRLLNLTSITHLAPTCD